MLIGPFDGASPPRLAQGPKSKFFHFKARICKKCNGDLTQAADREFDRFRKEVAFRVKNGEGPSSVFDLPRYKIGSEAYLNVFRYFAKMLCCQIAETPEAPGPCPIAIADFAIGRTDHNCIDLKINVGPNFITKPEMLSENLCPGHGGLRVPVETDSFLPKSFSSSLSAGDIHYTFKIVFDQSLALELMLFHHDFWQQCVLAYQREIIDL